MSSKTKIILVGGSKGGPGKSTIAQQIAGFLLVKAKKKVHLIDIDAQKTTYQWCQDRKSFAADSKLDNFSFEYLTEVSLIILEIMKANTTM
uniref:ParA-like protein n=1 Tax=Pectobacterium carotovorum TaxID=554 RepID=A0A0K0MNK8_PECCA|nr:AAA family ATPase [Pectobacterium carotovorum]AKG47491.1 ParA-like protein [Pectobacterium carotovorum]